MFKFITERIGVKVSLLVNLILLIVIAGGSFYLIRKQSMSIETQLLERGKLLSIIGAKAVSRIFEEAIDNGTFSVNDVLDKEYQPIPGFDPPK